MGKTSSPASVFKNANEAANRNKRQQERLQRKIQKAKHRFVWWAGIFFAWFPAVVILILALLVDNVEKNLETINNYKNFLHNFFTDGSFLWLSITLLGTSLLELILFGFKKYIGPSEKFKYIKLIVASIAVGIVAIIIYVVNIGSPINTSTMGIISGIAFILFAISSNVVSFKLVQEV